MTPTLACRTLIACGLVLLLVDCSRPGTKPAVAADTAATVPEPAAAAPAAAQVSADEAPAHSDESPQSAASAPAPAEPTGAGRVAFPQDSYDHAASDPFTVAATVYDGSGATLAGQTVLYMLDNREVAWMTGDPGKPCKDYGPHDRHISLTMPSGAPITLCGQKPGTTTLHASAMATLTTTTTVVIH
jgi:hypothetical protein